MKRKAFKKDGAKAFRLVSDMEDQLLALRRLFSVASLLVGTAENREAADALAHLATQGTDVLAKLERSRGEVFSATWGFVYGKEGDL